MNNTLLLTKETGIRSLQLPMAVFSFVFLILSIVQIVPDKDLLVLERFFPGGGWLQILIISWYGGLLTFHMQDSRKSAKWRRISWFLFSLVFFSQLIMGLLVSEKFLMTGKLHLPIPLMILTGPLYRGETSVMTFLFLGTVLLSGPAWCSHLCYFGGIDNYISGDGRKKGKYKNKFRIKHSLLFSVIALTLVFRWTGIDPLIATAFAISFGIAGILIMIYFSKKSKKMVHCTVWCPIGTIVNYYKRLSPFRMYIENDCTACMRCSSHCKYDALQRQDIMNHVPGKTCTLCGDCLSACHSQSIKYRFFRMNPEVSRAVYLFITISLHAVTLSLARI